MWDALTNIVTAAKDLLGIEVPELPVPGDLVSAAGEALTADAAGQVSAAAEAVSGTAAAAESAAATVSQAVTQAASDVTGAAGR